jgi:type IV pilus assembly protein PilW
MMSYRIRNSVHQSGFSLVEIMVALVVGLLATLVIMQVFSVFETQKRTTTGTADAQTNGSIALFSINREMQLAGYPLIPDPLDSPLDCATVTIEGVPGSDHSFFSPVIINDAVGPASSDSIALRYGTSSTGGVPSKITAVGAPGPNDVTVESNLGCQSAPPDTTLIINGTNCAVSQITAVPVGVNSSVTLSNPAGAVAGASFSCLGNWTTVTYSVAGGNLLRNGVPIIEGVVNLQAQYGISAAGSSNAIVGWVDATGAFAAPTLADRNRIKAVRIAVVARNARKEPTVVTTAPVTAWADVGAPVVDLTGYGADWNQYRYRVFDTIIPLRNVIWAKGTL